MFSLVFAALAAGRAAEPVQSPLMGDPYGPFAHWSVSACRLLNSFTGVATAGGALLWGCGSLLPITNVLGLAQSGIVMQYIHDPATARPEHRCLEPIGYFCVC